MNSIPDTYLNLAAGSPNTDLYIRVLLGFSIAFVLYNLVRQIFSKERKVTKMLLQLVSLVVLCFMMWKPGVLLEAIGSITGFIKTVFDQIF